MSRLPLVSKITAGICSGLLLVNSCSKGEPDSSSEFPATAIPSPELSCVVASEDSTSIFLGTTGALFSTYSLTDGAIRTYPLPEYTRGWKTYDIMTLGADRWLVAKQNNGVLYLEYAETDDGRIHISHSSQVRADSLPLPAKGTRFSTYSLIKADSLILIGSSNGLKYLTRHDIERLSEDSTVTARFAGPLSHMRKDKYQFSQEAMFLLQDSLLTVTDHGIYKLALSDLGRESGSAKVINPDMRCWDAEISGDSLSVLWSPQKNPDNKSITLFSLNGVIGSTRLATPATTWLGIYADSIREFGPQGKFQCFKAAVYADGKFYFIRNGKLAISDPTAKSNPDDERITLQSGKYGISNKSGLWRLDGKHSEFLGDIQGVSEIRGMSCNGSDVYLAVTDGIYRISASSRLLPIAREAELIEANDHRASDRVESVFAVGDTLLVGTRNGLHSFPLNGGDTKEYDFPELRETFESPYIRRIEQQNDGSFLLQTLNHGIWLLPSLDSYAATPVSGIEFSVTNGINSDDYKLERPALTWKTLAENIVSAVLVVLILTGVLTLLLTLLNRRHRLAITTLNRENMEQQSLIRNLEKTRTELQNAHEVVKRDLECTRIKLEQDLRLPIADVDTALKKACADMAAGNPLHDMFARYEVLTNAYISTSNPTKENVTAAFNTYFDINNRVDSEIHRVITLIGNIPPDSFLTTAFEEFAAKTTAHGEPGNLPLAERIKWLSDAGDVLLDSEQKALESIDSIIKKFGADATEFHKEDLMELWDKCIKPLTPNVGKRALSRPSKGNDVLPDVVAENRSLALTSVTLFDCRLPVVDGNPLPGDPRSIDRFVNSEQLGTVYFLWADNVSEWIEKNGNTHFPVNTADIFWDIWLSRRPKLSAGIRLAYARRHNRHIPEDVAQLLENRPKGRPRKT